MPPFDRWFRRRSKRIHIDFQLLSDHLTKTLNVSYDRAKATQEVLEEPIKAANEMDSVAKRGVDMRLTDDEIAFYGTSGANELEMQVMGDDWLKGIAVVLVMKVR